MSFINFSFTREINGGAFPSTTTTDVGFRREGGTLESVAHTNTGGAHREVEPTSELVATSTSLRDALAGASWLRELNVTIDGTRNVLASASWVTKSGSTGAASSALDLPTNVRRVLDAANAFEALAVHAPTHLPFVPHP